jgi:catechol 2,3-dioxygenase-like lactoylglutathione lyase family enzyme
VIEGIHAIVYSRQADEVRAFFRDVLGLESVEAGGGWPIFALPPAELAVHPADEDGRHELYLMCRDIHRTVDELREKGIETTEIAEQPWGLLTTIRLPGGGELGMYEPRHPTPLFTTG